VCCVGGVCRASLLVFFVSELVSVVALFSVCTGGVVVVGLCLSLVVSFGVCMSARCRVVFSCCGRIVLGVLCV